ncbi:MAG: Unknown protein [uncultured Thiotrichaceae bacterium]|uniref:Uncharacterized protein n=1 Tax=uncultured Thiotrichaceae bacterium TaxID=298394 RepID=A0A6S6U5M7_9GAMM|nr:MAG: Unknown protein [uncultured Thiotrichaceae bacterium]
METQIAAAAGSNGSLASVGHSLASVGTASKAFALVHPMTMAVAGGVLLGMGAYHTLGKVFKKKDTTVSVPVQEAVAT